MAKAAKPVLVEFDEGIAWVTLNRPDRLNALSRQLVEELRQAKKLGGDAKLVSPSPFAAKTFKMVGILSLFKVYDSEAEAVEACPA